MRYLWVIPATAVRAIDEKGYRWENPAAAIPGHC
jgi:hypothetical protein